MSLWNLIRDFLVSNIFGGTLSNGQLVLDNIIGSSYTEQFEMSTETINTTSLIFPVSTFGYSESQDFYGKVGLSLGDWLSTTFTIITLILLVIFLYIFVKWIFKLFSGLLH